MKKKIYVIGSAVYANWLDMKIVDNIKDADLVFFTGGHDVSPEVYGDIQHPTSHCNWDRDVKELAIFKEWLKVDIPTLGVCRGAQFLTATQLNGKLIQNCDGHAIGGVHSITDINGNILDITSTHHQMMYPYDINKNDYELIAWSTYRLSTYYEFGDVKLGAFENLKEPEIVYYSATRSLAIQGHPEYLEYDHITCKYLRELVKLKLFTKETI
jgi:hypothetical protein